MAITQAGFRIRSEDAVGLNTDSGWAAAKNTDVSMSSERRFRLRFELTSDASTTDGYELWCSVNGGAYALVDDNDNHYTATGALRSEISCVPSDQFVDLAATTQVISTGSFVAGDGCETNTSGSIALTSGDSTEIEWCLVIHQLYGTSTNGLDGEALSPTSYFDFQVRFDDGTSLDTYSQTPRITLDQGGVIGGTVAEQPDEFGPFVDGNGNLYLLVEYTESNNQPVMMKSTDDGLSWTAQDEAGAPTRLDWEGCAICQEGDDLLHVFVRTQLQSGPTLEGVEYNAFRMSSHPTTQDDWSTTGQTVDSDAGLKINSSDNMSAVYRGGTHPIALCYGGQDGGVQTVWLRTGSPGSWNSRVELDTSGDAYGSGLIGKGETDCYISYIDRTNEDLYYKKLDANSDPSVSGLGTRVSVSTTAKDNNQSHTKPMYYDDSGVEVITFSYHHSTTDQLWTRQMRDGTLQTALQASDNATLDTGGGGDGGSMTRCLAVDASTQTVYAFWIEDANQDKMYYSTSVDGAAWATPTEYFDLDTYRGTVDDGKAAWSGVKCRFITHTNQVIAVVTTDDAGGTGGTYYSEIFLRSGPKPPQIMMVT